MSFSTLFVFAQQWKNRGMITSTGKPHKDVLLHLLEAIQLPHKVTVCKCVAHTKGTDDMSVGNREADEIAKRVAQKTLKVLLSDTEMNEISSELLAELQDNGLKQERPHWKRKGAKKKYDSLHLTCR